MTWPDAFAIASIALCITAFAAWRDWLKHQRLFEKVTDAFQERRPWSPPGSTPGASSRGPSTAEAE